MTAALGEAGKKRSEIGILATAWLKRDENGLIEAARSLGKEMILPLPRGSQLPKDPPRPPEPVTWA